MSCHRNRCGECREICRGPTGPQGPQGQGFTGATGATGGGFTGATGIPGPSIAGLGGDTPFASGIVPVVINANTQLAAAVGFGNFTAVNDIVPNVGVGEAFSVAANSSGVTLAITWTFTITGSLAGSLGNVVATIFRAPANLDVWTAIGSLFLPFVGNGVGAGTVLSGSTTIFPAMSLVIGERLMLVVSLQLDSGASATGFVNGGMSFIM